MFTKIDELVWTDEKFKTLSDDGKLLFLFALSCPHRNILGLYVLPIPYGAYDLGWDVKRFSKGLRELLEKGFINYCFNTNIVFLKNFLKYNPIENPNQVKKAIADLKSIPINGLDKELRDSLSKINKPFMEPLLKRLQERLGKHVYVDVDVDVDVDIYKGDKPPTSSKKFIPPTIEEIKTYCQKRNNGINPNKFHDFYQSKNWMVGKNKMTDWKASVRTWERSDKDGGNKSGTGRENKEVEKHNLSGIIRG